jgi:hypothetical protein
VKKYKDQYLSLFDVTFALVWFICKHSRYFPLATENNGHVFFLFIRSFPYIFLSAIYSPVHLIPKFLVFVQQTWLNNMISNTTGTENIFWWRKWECH